MRDALTKISSDTETINTYFSSNLCNLMNQRHISASELARELNLPYNTINRLINGQTTDPRISTLGLIASYFDVSLDSLFAEPKQKTSVSGLSVESSTVPIASWEMLQNSDFLKTIHSEQWEHWLPVSLISINEASPDAYALESRRSMHPRFPMGTYFIIDPDCQPIDGDLILVRMKKDLAVTLRELIIDPPSMQLLPTTENSKTLAFNENEHEMIGVVVLTIHHNRRG